jgi:hydroxyethylthiazole kinase-like uncharacterized protein yjeF
VASSQRIEAAELARLPFNTLMQRAGLAVAKLAHALAPHARRAWIAAGPGNNGGDGFEAAVHLQAWGLDVQVHHVGSVEALPPDARAAYQRARHAGICIVDAATAEPPFPLGPQDIAIDALLGVGARRPPEGALSTLIDRLNVYEGAVLAVDLPSGLNADTGVPLGASCVLATHTISLLTLKPGLFTAHGRDHSGRVWFNDLDVAAREELPDAWLAGPPASLVRSRAHATHKGSFGDVAIVGGATGMAGAALLAAHAAHAAGAGRVYVQLLAGANNTLDATRPELMWRPSWCDAPVETLHQATVACGCGGGQAVGAVLPRLLSHVPRLVLDADALNAVAADATLAQLLRARAPRGHASVLTPHPLEAARLLGQDTREVQADRLGAAEALAQQFGCVVVLKGSGSVIAAPGQVPVINPTGNAALASPGTGDVLAGWLAGLWSAQGAHANTTAAHEAARCSVWTHGLAADRSRDTPLRAADLVEHMHALASEAAR